MHDASPTDSDLADQRLIARIRQGDAAAWTELIQAYQPRLYTLCLRMVGNHQTAQDLTHDAFVKVIQSISTFDARARLSTWIIRITMNTVLTHLRAQKLRRHASLDAPKQSPNSDPSRFSEPPAREPGASSGVERQERARVVTRALSLVSEEHRAILVLRDVRGLEYDQIAAVLDVPPGTVKSRLFRARSALREAIENLEGNGAEP